MEIIDYIRPELLIVAVVCYLVGVLLKKSKLKDNYIPLIIGGVGITIAIVYCGFMEGWSFTGVMASAVQGLLCAAASTYINQVIKQLAKNHNVDLELVEKAIDVLEGENKDDE